MRNNKDDSKSRREPYNQPVKFYGDSGFEGRSAWIRSEGAGIGFAVALEIKRAREAAKMTKKELAGKLKISEARVARIELDAGDVTIQILSRIALALNGRLDIRIVREK